MLTPADIHNKEFKRGFRGYSEEEVDDFLDEIVTDYEAATKRIAELEGELALAVKKGAQYQDMEKQLQETLAVAQKTAEEVVKTARLRADEKLREADLECDRKRRQTEAECDELRRKAEADARRQVEEAQAKVKAQRALYNDGVQRRRDFVIKMKSLLRSELEILEGTPDEEPFEAPGGKGAEGAKQPPASALMMPEPATMPLTPAAPKPGNAPEPSAAPASKPPRREVPISEQDTATNFTGIKHRVEALLKMDERSLGTRRAKTDEARGEQADAKEQR